MSSSSSSESECGYEEGCEVVGKRGPNTFLGAPCRGGDGEGLDGPADVAGPYTFAFEDADAAEGPDEEVRAAARSGGSAGP